MKVNDNLIAIAILILIVLFWGKPDLHDGLIIFLTGE